MTTTVQERKNLPWKYMRRIIYILAIITLLFFIGGAITWILSQLGIIQGAWTDKLFTILTGLGAATTAVLAIFGIFQFFLSLIPSEKAPESAASPTPPITVQFSLPQQTPSPSPSPDKIAPHGILGLPPPTDPRTIEQRQPLVKDIYTKLTQPDVTAIVLTGIGGIGKSTLAALVHRYAEEQRLTGSSLFAAEALWLTVSPAVTLTDLIGTLFEALGKPLPDLAGLTPQNQAAALFNALNTVDRARLVVLDQFENLLDWQTGQTLADRPGIAEWLDALNSQLCRCRVLLTSRPMPQGTREYPATYMQEYSIGGLEMAEGIALLRKQGVGEGATEGELRTAVERCRGHAFALTLLASLLRKRSLTLATFLQDPAFTRLWTGNIARNLLNSIYTQQLDPLQRKLLLAFSVYREPVALEAAQAVIDLPPEITQAQMDSDLDVLLAQHLLQASGGGRYQLHTIVADYAQSHFDEHDEQANLRAMQAGHASAAQYYLQQATTACPPREQRRSKSDIQPLIEATWQYCQAGQWQEAYDLMEQEGIFIDLNRWSGNIILLELYQLLLPVDKWHPESSQAANISHCLGWIYDDLGKKEEALRYYERALRMWREAGDRWGESATLVGLGRVYDDLGQKEQALRYYEQALAISREVGDRGGEGTTLNNLGRVYNALGQKEQALSYYEQALGIFREVGNRGVEGTTLNNLGRVYDDLGQKEQALRYYEQALGICREVGNRGVEGTTLNNLGKVYDDLGQKEQALSYYEQALGIRREVGDRGGEGTTLNNLGKVYDDLGQKEQALRYYEQALGIYREVGDRSGEGTTLNNLGKVYDDLGQKEQALRYYEQALGICREVGDRGGEGDTLNNLGLVYDDLGQKEQALSYYEQALDISKEVGDRGGEGTTLNNLGKVYDDLGNKQEALHYYEQALGILREVGNRYVEGVTLHNIGTIYFEQEGYDVALACFLLARSVFEEVQSPDRDDEQEWIDGLQQGLGKEQFAALIARVEPQASQIVEQVLREGL